MRRIQRVGAGRRTAFGIALAAILISGCSAGATFVPSPSPSPSPAPSASPSPSPSPSPDVTGLFIASLQAMTKASMAIDGNLQVGTVPVTMTGRYDVSGQDHYSTITTAAGSNSQTVEETVIGGKTYKRTGDAPWYEETPAKASPGASPASAGTDVGSVMKSVMSVKDKGLVSWHGQQLHQLSTGESLDPHAIGIDGKGTVSLDFYAKDDGTPASMVFTVDVTAGTAQAPTHTAGTLEFAITPAADVTIKAPDPLFVMFTSSNGYAFGHPDGWDARSEKGWEGFDGPNGETVAAYSQAKGTQTLTGISAGDVQAIKTDLKGKVSSNVAVTLGGEPARLITYTYKDSSGADLIGMDVVAVHKKIAVMLSWDSLTGNETADGKTFGYVVESFRFTK